MRILLIDDNKPFLEMLELVLGNRGWEIIKAGSKEELLDCLNGPAIDFVLSDFLLGDELATEQFDQIRTTWTSTRIYVMTGSDLPEDWELLNKLKNECIIDGALAKPFSIEKLFSLIEG